MTRGPLITATGFFHPSFNAAIFDGPLRVYFQQASEALALSIYIRSKSPQARVGSESVFVMLYPNGEEFSASLNAAGPQTRILMMDPLTARPIAFRSVVMGDLSQGESPDVVIGLLVDTTTQGELFEVQSAEFVRMELSDRFVQRLENQAAVL